MLNQQKLSNQYKRFFQGINTLQLRNIAQQNLKKHKIILLDQGGIYNIMQQSYQIPKLDIKYTQQQATIIQYEVIIAKFKLQITMLNFDMQAPVYKQHLLIGSGSFGTVRLESTSNRKFIVKRQKFITIQKSTQLQKQWNMNANKYDIDCAILEFCLYKICSLYKIGPAVDTEIGFDLLCYKNHIEFHLQFCDKIFQNTKFRDQFNYEQFERQMKQNLKLMHELKLIHKDVKPDNMLYSHQYKRYVLTDFGLSHSVEQNIGQKSKTFFAGSPRYMNKQMKSIYKCKKQEYVDLYDNDLHGLRLTFKQILEILKKKKIQKKERLFKQQLLKIQGDFLISSEIIAQNLLNQKLDDLCKKKSKIILRKQKQQQKKSQCIKQLMKVSQIKQIQPFNQSINIDDGESQYNNLKQQIVNNQYVLESVDKMQKSKQFIFTNKSKRNYEYLKLKYIAIKNNQSFQNTEQSWNYLSNKQIQYILNIIIDSSDLRKKKQVYDIRKDTTNDQQKVILSKIKESLDQKQIIIVKSNKVSELKLKNYLRIYGYDIQTLQLCKQLKQQYTPATRYDRILSKIKHMYQEKSNKSSQIDYNFGKRNIIKQLRKRLMKAEKNIRQNKYQILRLCIEILEYVQQYQKSQYIAKIEQLSIQRNEVYDIIYRIQKLFIRDQKNIIKYSEQEYKKIIQSINKLEEQEIKQKLNEKLFYKLIHYGKYNQSVIIGENILKLNTKNSTFLYKLAQNYLELGLYEKAQQYSLESIQMRKKLYQQVSLAVSYHQLSSIYSNIGKYQKAISSQQNCLMIQKKYYGEQHPNIAASYHQIAMIYFNMGKYQKALKYSQNSILIDQKYFGQQHPNIAASYHLISQIYCEIGKYQLALKYSENSISIDKKYFDEYHPSIAASYYQVALIYQNMGKYEQALKYSQKSIQINKKYYGQEHPNIAKLYHQISILQNNLDNYEIALKYAFNSIQLNKKYFGEMHPNIAASYHQVSIICLNMGKYQQALKYIQESILINKKYYGQQHPNIAASYHQVSTIYLIMGKYQQALKYQESSILINKKYYGQQHPNIATSCHQLSIIYYHMGQDKQSLSYSKLSLSHSYFNNDPIIKQNNHQSIKKNIK